MPLLRIAELDCGSLRDVALALAAGETVGLRGPSGSGKTRLLRAIADLDVHQGQAWLDGTERRRFSGPQWRRRVGYLPAESHWWGETVAEHFPALDLEALAALALPAEVAGWPVTRLSSGERQRLALLRLFSRRPRVALLDEPTANLDPDSAGRAEAFLRARAGEGTALLWVSHDPDQLRRVAGRCLEAADGALREVTPWP